MKILPALLSALTFASVGYAQQAETCSTHTVARGETLRIIAETYLGSRDQSPVIFAANRSTVGSNPNLISVGMVLNIPCASGQTATAAAATPAPEPAPASVAIIATSTTASTTEATRSMAAPSFVGGFVAVLSEAPLTGASLEGGGAMTRFMKIALDAAGSSIPNFGVSTLGNAASLDAMTKNAAIEVGFPVIRPDCFSPNLSSMSRQLCNDFYFSSPVFEIVTQLFALSSDQLQISTAEDLAGKIVCLPDFYPFEELQDLGLALNEATMIEPGSIASCFESLRAGDVDLVYADILSVNRTEGDTSQTDEFEALSRFTWVKTVHAVAFNGNAGGVESLTSLNQGIAALVFGDQWRGIMMDLLSTE